MEKTSKDLLDIFNKLESKYRNDKNKWCQIYLGLVGTYYSLKNYTSLPKVARTLDSMFEAVPSILNTEDKDVNASWTVGYYLNNAELRISSVLHRTLKAYTEEEDMYVIPLAKGLVEKCAQFEKLPEESEAKKILSEFIEEKNTLNKVHKKVNALKHDTSPGQDIKDAKDRFESTLSALKDLIIIYRELAERKNIINKGNPDI